MGEAYFRDVLQNESVRVGLLANGEEDSKGNDLTKEAFPLLKKLPSFIGNVEGGDIFNGSCDVIVCDGFTGNIVLKTSEGVASSISKLIKQNIKKSPTALTGALLMRRVFKLLKKQMDYAEYGGAPLLGIDGCAIICHGKSNPKAIKNAVFQALAFVESNINDDIQANIAKYKV
jgi:glycerol-3-phosphate acyltransferase PlsX